jgi:HPt (histidine-containing phosphotransfer) domain-containing protein
MDDFLSKPFRPSSLEKVLKLHIKSDMLPLEAPSPWVPDLDPNAKRSEKLIRLFLDRLPGQLADLDSAIRRERSGDVRACAHKLKGSCLAVGADRMTETAEAVRKHGAEARFGEAALALDELKRRFERVGAQLRAELPAPAETVSA